MKSWRSLVAYVLVVVLWTPGYADKAHSAYKDGTRAEKRNNYDAAFEAYKQAHELKPKSAEYLAAYARLRFYAGSEHVRAGQLLLEQGKLNEALAEFQRAAQIDGSSFIAQQEIRRTADMIKKQAQHPELPVAAPKSPLAKMAEDIEGPVELQAISTTPINLRMSENVDFVYKIIGKLAGINVLFEPDYKAPRISIELNDVTPREALDMLALQSKTFWQPVSPNTIFVASDTPGKRKDLQNNVMTTFYLRNVSTTTELQDAANTLKGILDVSRVQLIPNQNAIILRGTADQMVLAEKLLSDIDKPKAEVIIDVAVMQVSRDRIRTLGVNPPTSASVVMLPTGPRVAPAGSGSSGSNGSGSSSGSSGSSGTSGGSGSHFTVHSLGNLSSNNFEVSIPGASVSFLMSDSNTKLIQNPQIRALDNEKATLKIGDRVPVATGSFAPGIGGGGISPLVNTQFQYLDVGVNIDIVPHIHSDHEVTLKMVLEISSVTGSQNIGGISQPVIGQRRIEHETRLEDGDVNLIGGILEESETQSLSGYPWLAKLPILKYLFGQETKDRRQNEIVFAITPHIVRGQYVTDQNMRVVDVGTGGAVGLRHRDVRTTTSNNAVRPTSGGSGPAQAKDPKSDKPSPTATRVAPPASQSRPVEPDNARPQNSTSPAAPVPAPASQILPAVADRSTTAQSAQRLRDPCPFGQHSIGVTKGVVTCAFD